MKKRPLEEKFWEKVRINSQVGCWEWIAYLNTRGYGVMRVGDHTNLAHRIAWVLLRGPIPENLYCLHKCDNPKCVNPDHLFLGTKTDNNKDKGQKHRGRGIPQFGELNRHAKLSWEKIAQIRSLWDQENLSQSQIGKMFNITQSTISRIVRDKGWTKTL